MSSIPANDNLLNGMLVVDPLTRLVKGVLVALTIFTVLVSIESNFTDHIGEYWRWSPGDRGNDVHGQLGEYPDDFVSLELVSLSLYILTAFNKHNIKSAEAALKYFLFEGCQPRSRCSG
jgi:NADH-quinone oxidoreductase subunit N